MDPPRVKLYLLGASRTEAGGSAVDAKRWGRRRASLLVKFLALQPQRRAHREQLVDLFWPELETSLAVNNLNKTIHLARRALEPDVPSGAKSRFLLTHDQHVALAPAPLVAIDADDFEALARRALRSADAVAGEAALDLYGGELLADEPYEEWTVAPRERLRALFRDTLFLVSDARVAAGEHAKALDLLKRLLASDATDEEAHRRAMTAYAASGNAHQALRQFRICRDVLRRELDAEPERATVDLARAIESGGKTPASNAPAREDAREPATASPLPVELTSFVGREREAADVRAALARSRIVTLAGPGGIGKTRLSLHVASDLLAAHPGGAWFVPLAPVAGEDVVEDLVAPTVAASLGVTWDAARPAAATLAGFLRDRRALLVLDNCEHVVASCARLVDALARACPHLRVLATSREPLGVPGEHVVRVPALPVPDEGERLPSRLAEFDAVRLFLERALPTLPNSSLTADDARAIAEICRRLDGLPLAIELAAARARAMSVATILARLDDRFRLLSGGARTVAPRQQTLRAAVDWSYDLLSEPERALLRRAAAFAGGWTLEAAEAVASGDGGPAGADVLDLLTALADKSLVVAERGDDGFRYRMLETVRAYAGEKLEAAGEGAAVRSRHLAWYLGLAHETKAHLFGPDQRLWLARIEADLDNFRAALRWGIDRAEKGALDLAAVLVRFWTVRGHLTEGRGWIEGALAAVPGAPTSRRAAASYALGALCTEQGAWRDASAALDAAAALQREAGDEKDLAHTLGLRGYVEQSMGDYDRARASYAEALALHDAHGAERGAASVRGSLGILEMDLGEYERAAEHFRASLAAHERLGNAVGVEVMLHNMGEVALRSGRLDEAADLLDRSAAIASSLGDRPKLAYATLVRGHVALRTGAAGEAEGRYVEALRAFEEIGDRCGLAYALEGFSRAAAARGDYERAARLAGAAASIRERIDFRLPPSEAVAWDETIAAARSALGAARSDDLLAEGGRASDREAAAWAAGDRLARGNISGT